MTQPFSSFWSKVEIIDQIMDFLPFRETSAPKPYRFHEPESAYKLRQHINHAIQRDDIYALDGLLNNPDIQPDAKLALENQRRSRKIGSALSRPWEHNSLLFSLECFTVSIFRCPAVESLLELEEVSTQFQYSRFPMLIKSNRPNPEREGLWYL